MGVPKFTAWLKQQQKHYNTYFIVRQPKYVDNLFIDANSTIYDVVSKLEVINEDDIINGVLKFYDELIDMIKPTMTYIAIDGVVPFSKITQQRIRRYTSYYLDNTDTEWHPNSNISPGTPFMIKLDKALIEYSKNKNIIYSSFWHHGEGEHKIIQYIKKYGGNKINMIYGNDTDIIFLSLIAHLQYQRNIYLFKVFEKQNQFYKVALINKLLCELFNQNNIEATNKHIYDFIILCFIIGNDFLQHIPFIDAFKLQYVISSYITALQSFNGTNIINDDFTINYNNLMLVMKVLSEKEVILFKLTNDECKLMLKYNRKPTGDKKIIEEFRIKQNDYSYFDSIVIDKCNDIINMSSLITYKYNYYNYYIKTNNTAIINDMLCNYFEGFNWTVDYYFNTSLENDYDASCNNWDWYYKYPCVPFISDIYNYLSNNTSINNSISNNSSKPLTVDEQLFYIIPPKYLKSIQPAIYDVLINHNYLMPLNTRIDTLHKGKLWECHAIVPLTDANTLRQII